MGFVLMKVTFCLVLFFYRIKLDYPPTKLSLNFSEYDPKTFRKTAANVQLMPNIETLQLPISDRYSKNTPVSRPESSFTFPLFSYIN